MSQLQQLINSFSNENLIEYQTSQFDISEDKTSLTAELSTLQLLFAPQFLWVRNSTGQRCKFDFVVADKGYEGEVVGFRYASEVQGKPTISMLLIND